jgi:hypothetical protein
LTTIAFTRRYAHGATTATEKTRSEIEAALKRFGAKKFAYMTDPPRSSVLFEYSDRRVRFDLPDPKETLKPYNRWPSTVQVDAEERRLWRSLLMAIKAKLEIVQSGISTFEDEFLPYTQLADGRTFAEAAKEPKFVERLSSIGRAPFLALGGAPAADSIDAEFTEDV